LPHFTAGKRLGNEQQGYSNGFSLLAEAIANRLDFDVRGSEFPD